MADEKMCLHSFIRKLYFKRQFHIIFSQKRVTLIDQNKLLYFSCLFGIYFSYEKLIILSFI